MSDIEKFLPKFEYVPINLINRPPRSDGPYMIMDNRYWEIKDGCVLFYRGFSPQCNVDKSIVERMARKEGNQVFYIPRVYIPLNSNGDFYLKDLLEKADIDKKRAEALKKIEAEYDAMTDDEFRDHINSAPPGIGSFLAANGDLPGGDDD